VPTDATNLWLDTQGETAAQVGATMLAAAADLANSGQTPDPFTTQESELQQLAAIPLTDLSEDTQQQQAEAEQDITALDQFFGTPNLRPAGQEP
jgi:hypothetical protein